MKKKCKKQDLMRLIAVFLIIPMFTTTQSFTAFAKTVSDNKILTEAETAVRDNDVNVGTKKPMLKKKKPMPGCRQILLVEMRYRQGLRI